MSNIAEFSRQNNRNEDAFRLLLAGLFLADSDENIDYALAQMGRNKAARSLKKVMRKRSREFLFRTQPGYKTYRRLMRSIVKRISNLENKPRFKRALKI